MTLLFHVDGQTISRADSNRVAAGSRNYLFAEFTFSQEWQGTATAVFKRGNAVFNVLIDENGRCEIPPEVLSEGQFSVSCFCGDRITSDRVYVTVATSNTEPGSPERPSEDVYAQIIRKLDNAVSGVNAVVEACESGALRGDRGDKGDPGEPGKDTLPYFMPTSIAYADFEDDGSLVNLPAGSYYVPHTVQVLLNGQAAVISTPDQYEALRQYFDGALPKSSLLYTAGDAAIPAGAVVSVVRRDNAVLLKMTDFVLPDDTLPFTDAVLLYNGLGFCVAISGELYFNSLGAAIQNITSAVSAAGVNYSSAEQEIGTWLDGKAVYEKSFLLTTPNEEYVEVLTLSEIDKLIRMDGTIFNAGAHQDIMLPIRSQWGDGIYWCGEITAEGKLSLRTGSSCRNRDCFITLQYTKKTEETQAD